MWVWVSMVRWVISSSEIVSTCPPRANRRTGATFQAMRSWKSASVPHPDGATQAPVCPVSLGYKRAPATSPTSRNSLMTRDRPCPHQERTARRGRRSGPRQWPLHGRPAPAEPGLCRLRALAACACAHQVGRYSSERCKAKGVLAVLTAADIKAAGIGGISRHPPVVGRGGAKMVMPFRPALAGDKAMHVGDRGGDGGGRNRRRSRSTPPIWSRSTTRNCRRWSISTTR